MNSSFLIVGVFLLLFVAFLFFYPNAKNNVLGNFILMIVIIFLGGITFFQESIGTRILESGMVPGIIEKPLAEEFVAEKYGVSSLYSWYGGKNFRPAIFIMVQTKNAQKKIILNALTGEPLDEHISSISNISFADFLAQKTTAPVEIIPQISDTEAPKIQITFPADGQVFDENTDTITVTAEIWDAVDKSPVLNGTGEFTLQKGFNSVIVTGSDASGNVGSAYVVVEKK